ncbi:2'-5' RNA ligase family protein [Salarchaeum japonicum]|uniref:2'-5' RNA ligase family protein n=1 Tax=Salarchaeum japonicum TaxID=555573 RepID=UPI0031D4A636
MYSVNVPVPDAVHDVVEGFRPLLTPFDRVRERRTRSLVAKRLPAENRREYRENERRARDALRGAPSFECRISDVGVFEHPPSGTSPVVYLAVESPGLREVHGLLCDAFDPVPGMEGDDYAPHVTLARDLSGFRAQSALDDVLAADFDPVTWTVTELEFRDATHHERISTLSLPA